MQIAGFTLEGTAPKRVLIRAVGPALKKFGIKNALEDPVLEIYRGQTLLYTNDDWEYRSLPGRKSTWKTEGIDDLAGEFTRAGAFAFDTGSKDAAIILHLDPGSYTAVMKSADGKTGVGLVEVYELNDATPARLYNLSTRSLVGSGENVQIGGFVVTGSASRRVLIRASGPGLAKHGVSGTLANPKLEIRQPGGALIASNDDWDASLAPTFVQAGAFAWDTGSKDAALLLDLPPGNYTAIVSSSDSSSGVALIEAYDVK